MKMDVNRIIAEIIAVYSVFLMIFGSLGNLFSFYICTRKQMRSIPTFVFYAFLHGSNMLTLFWWNLDHYYTTYYGYLLENQSLELCRSVTFFQTFSFQSSAWLLVAMTVERFLSIIIKNWRNLYFKPFRAFLISIIICSILFIVNISFMSVIDKTDKSDPTYNITCYFTYGYGIWMQEQNYMFCFLPFTIMMITNILLVYRITVGKKKANSNNSQQQAHKSKTTRTVLIVTSLFLIFSLPSALANAFFLDQIFSVDYGLNILYLTDIIVFTFTSFDFVVLFISNKQFAREVNNVLRIMTGRRSQVSVAGTNTNLTVTRKTNVAKTRFESTA